MEQRAGGFVAQIGPKWPMELGVLSGLLLALGLGVWLWGLGMRSEIMRTKFLLP